MPGNKNSGPPKGKFKGVKRGGKDKLKLSDRQLQVLKFYYGVSRLNKTDALRRAGYSTPAKEHVFYSHPAVKAEMERRRQEMEGRYEISYDNMIGELARVAKSNIFDYADIDADGNFVLDQQTLANATVDQLAAIGEVTVETYMDGKGEYARQVKKVKVKPWNKTDALEKVIKHAGLSKDKLPEGTVDLVSRIIAARNQVATEDDK